MAAALLALESAMTPASYLPTNLSPWPYRLTQPFVWLRYAGELVLPLHLNADTDLGRIDRLNVEAIAGLFFMLLLIGVVVYCSRQRRLYPIAFGVVWFLVTQLPTSVYALAEVENDHRMFFSFPGLMLAVVWALYLLYERLRGEREGIRRRAKRPAGRRPWLRPAALTLAALCLCGYAYGAHRRNAVWRTEATLWADDVAKSPHNGRGLMMYGLTRMNEGDDQGALALFERALVCTPNYPDLELNLGIVNAELARRGEAERAPIAENHFRRALALAPDDDRSHAFYAQWLLAQGRLGEATAQLRTAVAENGQRPLDRDLLMQAYVQPGKRTEARTLAEETIHIVPGDEEALAVLNGGAATGTAQRDDLINDSLAAYQAGRYEESIEKARATLALDPHSAAAWNNVGASEGALSRWDEAIDAEQKALAVDPGLVVAQNNLRSFEAQRTANGGPAEEPKTAADWIDRSLALNKGGQYQESLTAAQQALKLDPNSAEAWNNVAADEEAMQHWDAAIEAVGNAVALRPDFQVARNNLAWSLQQKAMAAKH